MCRKVNLASFSSWMYIAYILYWFVLCHPFHWFLLLTKRGRRICWFCFYFNPFVDDWQKGGEVFEKYFSIYACFPYFIHKGGENSIFIFQLVFVFPLPYFMIKKKWILILIWYHMFKMKNTYNWYQDVYVFILIGIKKIKNVLMCYCLYARGA